MKRIKFFQGFYERENKRKEEMNNFLKLWLPIIAKYVLSLNGVQNNDYKVNIGKDIIFQYCKFDGYDVGIYIYDRDVGWANNINIISGQRYWNAVQKFFDWLMEEIDYMEEESKRDEIVGRMRVIREWLEEGHRK